MPRGGGFFGRQVGDAALVLVELVALGFEVEDCSVGDSTGVWLGRVRWRTERMGGGEGDGLVLGRYTAGVIAHCDIWRRVTGVLVVVVWWWWWWWRAESGVQPSLKSQGGGGMAVVLRGGPETSPHG